MCARTCYWILLAVGLWPPRPVMAQRTYTPVSVLASGNWYKLGVSRAGVYRVDLPFLQSLGVATGNLPSASIRLYGNGGAMLPEANASPRPDDLVENAIWVADGGDGQFGPGDYFLFYAPGPDTWVADSVNRLFTHRKNLYSDTVYFFLTLGGTGRRVASQPATGNTAVAVTHFSERYFHELDTVNFLSSGKEWYGEELSALPGRSLTRRFTLPLPDAETGSAARLRFTCAARSVGGASRFDVALGGQPVAQTVINAVGGGIYDLFAREAAGQGSQPVAGTETTVQFSFVPGSVNAQGWINWFELHTRRLLSLGAAPQLLFRDWNSVGQASATFILRNTPGTVRVWDITDERQPRQLEGSWSSGEYRFVNEALRLREYAAFDPARLPAPQALGRVGNQNLHAASPADLLIVVHPTLAAAAQQLADLHQQRGLRVATATTLEIYQEFAGGQPDPVAIRDWVKMYYDKFGSQAATAPRYLLLLGDASFDYKNRLRNNTSLVPAWQNDLSLDPLATYASDDFYGYLDDQEDINSGLVTNLLDIGIGRIPAYTPAQAQQYVAKVQAYLSPASLGGWRQQLTFVADDEDNNLHLQDAELITGTVSSVAPVFNRQKIYLDAFRQESGAGGSRYPEASLISNNQVNAGTLIWNYSGHGGYERLAEETILDAAQVNEWRNTPRLPLLITATCDFAPYDNPLIASLGENLLLRPQQGAIALMTTTRPVFAFSNRIMNNNYLRTALDTLADGSYRSLGDAVREAKNFTYQNFPDVANNRKFTLLGDPALTLGFPRERVVVTRINGLDILRADTLSALETVTVEGEVRDRQGNLLSGFNGQVFPEVFDKVRSLTTLANDPGSQAVSFPLQQNRLFRGTATVSGGRFSFQFKVPRDINYQFGAGRISLYAHNGQTDAGGFFTGFVVGGAGSGSDGDQAGPLVRAWLNDRQFVNGGLTNASPVLLLSLEDSSGINTTGAGIGHDLIAELDGDQRQFFRLNDFYQGAPDSYQRGEVRFPLPALTPGPHQLRIKAWDVVNNSSEITLDFVVGGEAGLQISRVLNYPNPFTTRTSFWFEHNQPGRKMQVEVRILTLGGRLIRTLREEVTPEGNRCTVPEWDGRDQYGDRPGRGVYLYQLRVNLPGQPVVSHLGKLALL